MAANLNVRISIPVEESVKVTIHIDSGIGENDWTTTSFEIDLNGYAPKDIDMLWKDIRSIADDMLVEFLKDIKRDA